MAIPIIVILGNLLQVFVQWAVKQIVKKYGKQILMTTFREAMRFLLKKYGPKEAKIQRGMSKMAFDEWLLKGSSTELRTFFRKYGVDLIEEPPTHRFEMQSLPRGKLNEGTNNPKNSHISKDAYTWYTLKGTRLNLLPKSEL